MSNVLFSLVLPIYNVEKYLERCVQSILKQDYKDFEIILVDDGSVDLSSTLCDYYANQDKRIRVIHKPNEGLGKARNSGLSICRGDYVLFVDSDDYIKENTLSSLANEIASHKSEIVFYGFERVSNIGKVISTSIPKPKKMYYDNHDEIKDNLLPDFIAPDPQIGMSTNLRISAWTCCISRHILINNNLFFPSEREYISEDVYFYLFLFDKLHTVSFLPDALYCYCQNEGSLTTTYKANRFERIKKFYGDICSLCDDLSYNPNIKTRFLDNFIANTMGCLKLIVSNKKQLGFKASYDAVKTICKDNLLLDVLREFDSSKYPRSWRIFKKCVLKQKHLILYYSILFKYSIKKI